MFFEEYVETQSEIFSSNNWKKAMKYLSELWRLGGDGSAVEESHLTNKNQLTIILGFSDQIPPCRCEVVRVSHDAGHIPDNLPINQDTFRQTTVQPERESHEEYFEYLKSNDKTKSEKISLHEQCEFRHGFPILG